MNWLDPLHYPVFYVVMKAYVHYFTIQGKKKREGETGNLSMWLFEGIQLIFAGFLA
jgi:hypothetical protein